MSIQLQLWDIAGQERFSSMTRVYYKQATACVIIFDITRYETSRIIHEVFIKPSLSTNRLTFLLSCVHPCSCGEGMRIETTSTH